MTIQLRPDQERIIQEQLASGRYGSVEEIIETALSKLSFPEENNPSARGEAVRRMREFGERHQLSLGEPLNRQFLHEGHRF
jgi:Arc/MetJ-type ribon-helix-helix transcriptional regulator